MSKFRPSESAVAAPPLAPKPRIVIQPQMPPNGRMQEAAGSPEVRSKPVFVDTEIANPIRRIALFFALGYLFVQISFLHEIIGIALHLPSYLPSLFGIPAFMGFLFCGGIKRLFREKTAYAWVVFILWLVVTTPLSSWPTGSLLVVKGFLQSQVLSLFLLGGLVCTLKDLRLALYSVTAAGLVNLLTGTFMTKAGSRLELEIVTIGNSNDFAAQLLLLMPLFWVVSSFTQIPRVLRYPLLAAIPYAIMLSLSTGSRGALVAMMVAFVYVVIRARGFQRLVLILVVPLMLLVLVLKSGSSNRLATLFDDNVDSMGEAQASSIGRKELLKRGIQFTLQHPLFGVGPGQFSSSEGGQARQEGRRGIWMQTHNSYVQVSSETGIPGAIIMLAALIWSYRLVARVLREARERQHQQLERIALGILVSFICFCTAAFFLSLAYRFYFPMLAGLALALANTARYEFSLPASRPNAGAQFARA